jgi:hypothetical protein
VVALQLTGMSPFSSVVCEFSSWMGYDSRRNEFDFIDESFGSCAKSQNTRVPADAGLLVFPKIRRQSALKVLPVADLSEFQPSPSPTLDENYETVHRGFWNLLRRNQKYAHSTLFLGVAGWRSGYGGTSLPNRVYPFDQNVENRVF